MTVSHLEKLYIISSSFFQSRAQTEAGVAHVSPCAFNVLYKAIPLLYFIQIPKGHAADLSRYKPPPNLSIFNESMVQTCDIGSGLNSSDRTRLVKINCLKAYRYIVKIVILTVLGLDSMGICVY